MGVHDNEQWKPCLTSFESDIIARLYIKFKKKKEIKIFNCLSVTEKTNTDQIFLTS